MQNNKNFKEKKNTVSYNLKKIKRKSVCAKILIIKFLQESHSFLLKFNSSKSPILWRKNIKASYLFVPFYGQ